MTSTTEKIVTPLFIEDVKFDPKITSGFKFYPGNRNFWVKNQMSWVDGKRKSDGAWPYWRVHEKLYDLSEFVRKHPGGSFWIETTQGMDITESFESSHFGESIYKLLEKYYVKDAETPRNSPYTFKSNGFFMTLKKKVTPIILKDGKGPNLKSTLIQDGFLAVFLIFFFLSGWMQSIISSIIAGVLLGMCAYVSHNFFHLRDNWRMHIFDATLFSSYEWRISHAISHHNFPNTIYDYEIEWMEPFIYFLPKTTTRLLYKLSLIPTIIIIWGIIVFLLYVKRLIDQAIVGTCKFQYANLIPVAQIFMLMLLTGSVKSGFWFWYILQVSAVIYISVVGLIVSHHHTKIFHEGDRIPKTMDWGVLQLVATRDRDFVMGSSLLSAISFGHHILHHIFPTVDYMKLPSLQKYLEETCEEFGVEFKTMEPLELMKGTYRQILNNEPNPNMPDVFTNKYK